MNTTKFLVIGAVAAFTLFEQGCKKDQTHAPPSQPNAKASAIKPATKNDPDWRTDYATFEDRLAVLVRDKAPAAAPRENTLVTFFQITRNGKPKYVLYHGTEMKDVYDAINREFGGQHVIWRGKVEAFAADNQGATVQVKLMDKIQSVGGWAYPQTLSIRIAKDRYTEAQLRGEQVDVRGTIPDKGTINSTNLLDGIVLWYNVGVEPVEKKVTIGLQDSTIMLVASPTTAPAPIPPASPATTQAASKREAFLTGTVTGIQAETAEGGSIVIATVCFYGACSIFLIPAF